VRGEREGGELAPVEPRAASAKAASSRPWNFAAAAEGRAARDRETSAVSAKAANSRPWNLARRRPKGEPLASQE
jgi:hypothetical protein